MRPSKRQPDEMRAISFERGVSKHAEGSCLVKFGDTHVLCTASLEEKVPGWMRNSGKGWVTAEYGMLPRSTGDRMRREASTGKQGGRTLEIQRLIGTAEGEPFSEDEFAALMGLAKAGIARLVNLQKMAIG